jgi:ribosomal protein S18 acetylase RimI-like enzyme
MSVVVRKAVSQDIPRLLVMVHKLAQHHGDAATVSAEQLRRDMFGDSPWVRGLIATAAEMPIGYAIMCPLVQLHFGARGMDMHHLFVETEWRGKGVGRLLTMACLEEAKELGCQYMAVGTHPDNFAAQNFYSAQGFEQVSKFGARYRKSLA